MKTLGYILLSSLLLSLPLRIEAQESIQSKADAEKKKSSFFSLNSMSVSADIFGYAYSLLGEYTSGEAAVNVNLGNRLYPTVEIGAGWCSTTDETTGIKYKTAAPYYRVGFDYNFSTTKEKPNPPYAILGIFRFAWTSCKYDVQAPPITDPVWGGEASLNLTDVKGSASWAEIGVGLRMKIAKNFHMGWSIRYKARISQKKGEQSQMWYIPGYGINKSTGFGGTYSFIYEIPFK